MKFKIKDLNFHWLGHDGISAILGRSTNLVSPVRITFWRIFILILIEFSKYGGPF